MLVSTYAGSLGRLLLAASAKPAALSLIGTAARLPRALPIRPFSVTARSAFPASTAAKKKPARATAKRTITKTKKKPATGSKRTTAAKKKKPVAKSSRTVKAKKRVVRGKKKPVAKKRTTKRKVLTQEQKDVKERRALKKITLKEPKQLPTAIWPIFLHENASAFPGSNLTDKLPELSAAYKALSPAEIDVCADYSYHPPLHPSYRCRCADRFIFLKLKKLRATAEKNKLTNAARYETWISSKTPEEIRLANSARSRLSNKFSFKASGGKRIRDHRIPKRTCGAYGYYMKERWSSGTFTGIDVKEAAKKMGAEWKALSEAQKQVSAIGGIFPGWRSNQ